MKRCIISIKHCWKMQRCRLLASTITNPLSSLNDVICLFCIQKFTMQTVAEIDVVEVCQMNTMTKTTCKPVK